MAGEVRVDLPQSLEAQFAALQQRLWRIETLRTAAQIIALLAISFLALFVSDRLWNTPMWARWIISIAGVISAILVGVAYARRWWVQKRTQQELAIFVQRRYQRLGDRLLGIVELAHEHKRPPNFSPELYRAAIEQVAAEANKFDFPQAVPTTWLRRWGGLAAVAALIIVGLQVILPRTTLVTALRWALPFSAQDRHTLVALESLPNDLVVPHGEPFSMSVKVNYRSFWKPKVVTARIAGQPPVRAQVEGSVARLRFPGQVQRELVQLKAGDATGRFEALPTHRPALRALTATVTLPEYLHHPPQTQNSQSGALLVLEGSKVALQGSISRRIVHASLSTPDGGVQELAVTNNTFTTPPLDVVESREVMLKWRDEFGLEAVAPWKLAIQTTKDAGPTAELVDVPRDLAILHTENLELKTLGRDDYGVASVGLLWTPPSDGSTNAPEPNNIRIDAEGFDKRELQETFSFSPAIMNIPPDTVVDVSAYAVDYFPDRAPVQSIVYRIHVLGNAQHAEMVRQRLDSLAVQLEEVARLQEKVAAETAQAQDNPNLSEAEAGKKIDALQEQQRQAQRNLEQLAEEGAKTLREALRNPAFPSQTLQEWSKHLQQMQQVAKNEMQQSSQSMSEAKNSAQKRSENLAASEEKQQEALQKLQELQRKMQNSMDDLQALTLSERLRNLGGAEQEISDGLKKHIAETVGLLPGELPARFKRINTNLAENQAEAQTTAKELQDEISRFYERTQKTNYGAVFKAMTELKVTDELERMRGLINENIGMEAMQDLNRWSTQLLAWAELLEPPKSDGESGGGEGAGQEDELSKKVMQELIALLRLREAEINVREKTRLVDKDKEHEAAHAEQVKILQSGQSQILEVLQQVRAENPLAMVDPALKAAEDQMYQAQSLLNDANTGKPTTDTQTRAVEALTDAINLINENAKRPKPGQQQQQEQQPTAEEMAFLMQLMQQGQMGMQSGMTPGGSMAGGTTDRANTQATGNADGTTGPERSVNRASGSTANTPVEFREALQQYFQALEKAQ
ncbi:MAG TPA: hypothetical protein VEH27_05510 [Methylomirabilota bacterium]|nr:hypothetical protein [Methylomirabilota bacterium]